MTDEDRGDELFEDKLWRARVGVPGPLEMDARAIVENDPRLAALLELDEVLDGIGPLPAASCTEAELFAIGDAVQAGPADVELPSELAERLEAIGAALRDVADADPAPQSTTVEQVRDAIQSGASCSQLFKVRNGMVKGGTDYDVANELLRAVGCYRPGASRTDC